MPTEPQTPSEVESWLKHFFSVQDSLDPAQIPSNYAKDATMQFTNYPLIHGAQNIGAIIGASANQLSHMSHALNYFDKVGNRIWMTCHITYEVKGDPAEERFVIPAVGIFNLVTEGEECGKIQHFEVYLDKNKVEERVASVSKGQEV